METQHFLTEDLIMRAGDVGDWMGFVGQHSKAGVHIAGTIVAVLNYGMQCMKREIQCAVLRFPAFLFSFLRLRSHSLLGFCF